MVLNPRKKKKQEQPKNQQKTYENPTPAQIYDKRKNEPNFMSTDTDKSLFFSSCDLVFRNDNDYKFWTTYEKHFTVGKILKHNIVVSIVAKKYNLTSIFDIAKGILSQSTPTDILTDISKKMAQKASGMVSVLTGNEIREDSTWLKTELPALFSNENVTEIVERDARNPEWFKSVTFLKKDISEGFKNNVLKNLKNVPEESLKAYLKSKTLPITITFKETNRNPEVAETTAKYWQSRIKHRGKHDSSKLKNNFQKQRT